jgi:hypothetical protein
MTQRKNEKKEYWKMTDGIGRIFGGSNYSIGGFGPRKKEEAPKEQATQMPVNNYNETQVDPNKIMEFMATNNYFVAPTAETAPAAEVDMATQERVAGYMENFEMIYGVIAKEFGEEMAPMVMDFVMDYLMDMAA